MKKLRMKSATFNPLDFIGGADSPHAVDECRAIGNSIVFRTGEEREPVWNDNGEAYICNMTAGVVVHADKKHGNRTLFSAKELIAIPKKQEMAIQMMQKSDAWGGILAIMGGQLSQFQDKEKSSVIANALRHLRFMDTPAVVESLKTSSFDPAKLKKGKMTIYLVIPLEYISTQAGLLRLWITSLMRAVIRQGLGDKLKVHFLLDEFGMTGKMSVVEDMLAIGRGYGIRLQMYVQNTSQLKKCFGDQAQTAAANSTRIAFGIQEIETAREWSETFGDETCVVEGGGTSSGRGTSHSRSGHDFTEGGSRERGSSESWNQQIRRLMKPEELIACSPRTCFTLAPGMPPIATTLIRYYEEKLRPAGIFSGFRQAFRTLVFSIILFLIALIGAAVFTDYVQRAMETRTVREVESPF